MTMVLLNGSGGAALQRLADEHEEEREYAASLKKKYARIEGYLGPLLWRQLKRRRRLPVPDQLEADWKHFCRECALDGFESLPAAPAAVAQFLMAESNSAAEAERLCASISWHHRRWRAPRISDEHGWVAMQEPDPTTDILVLSVLDWFNDNEQEEKAELERQSAASETNAASKKESEKL